MCLKQRTSYPACITFRGQQEDCRPEFESHIFPCVRVLQRKRPFTMSIYYTRRVTRSAYTSGAGSFSSGYLRAGEVDSLVAAQSTRLDVSGVPFCPWKSGGFSGSHWTTCDYLWTLMGVHIRNRSSGVRMAGQQERDIYGQEDKAGRRAV